MDASTPNKQAAGKSGVCSQCVERCHREHHLEAAGGASGFFSSPPTHPCFLKTALEHNLRNNMSIPRAFMNAHGMSLRGSTVDLEGSNGKVWLVTVDAGSNGVAVFRYGWQVFAEDNSLKAGDSLLFTMVAKNRFTVRVFNRIGLESVPKPTKLNSNHKNHDSMFTPESQSKGVRYTNLDESDERVATGNVYESEGRESNFETSDSGEENGAYGPSIQEILKSHGYRSGDPTSRTKRKPWRLKHTTTGNGNQQSPPLDPGWNSTRWESRRRLVTNAERESAMTAAENLVTKHPSISLLMKPSHVYCGFWLDVPLEFAKLYLPQRRAHITLQDTFGFQWPAKWVISPHQTGVSGGWASFSRDHQLEEGDVCVFEVLDSKNWIILIHIFRVVEVPLVPGRRGGWDVTYNVVVNRRELPGNCPLTEVKTEPAADDNSRKRSRLVHVLHKMVRNGQFSRRQLEDLPSKLRELADDKMTEEDVKPDFKSLEQITDHFMRSSPHGAIKAEDEDVYPSTPTSLPVSVEVKNEPILVVKVEDVSGEDRSVGSVSPVSVYSRRRKKEGSSATRSPGLEQEIERVWYPVVRVMQKRQREENAEKDILVEIHGTVPEGGASNKIVEPGLDGLWWVPSSHFSSDYSRCYFT